MSGAASDETRAFRAQDRGSEPTWSPVISVVYFVPQLKIGGTERQLSILARGLDRSRFRAAVWCPGPDGPVGAELREAGIEIFSWPSLRSRRAVRFATVTVPALWRRHVDVFHSFGYGAHVADIVAARLARARVIINSYRNVRHWDPALRLRPAERIRRHLADGFLANSEAGADVAARVEGIPRAAITVIHSGVDAWGEHARGRTPGKDPDVVVSVGNLKDVKGHDLLIRAFAMVRRECPAQLVIVGDGPRFGALVQLAEQLGIGSDVRFVRDETDPRRVLVHADLYVHPSRAEGFSTAILEAMSCGLPVVAFATGGTPEAVRNGIDGYVVAPGAPEALAQAMSRILRLDAIERGKLGRAAEKRVTERFSSSEMIRRHEAYYVDLLGTVERRRRSAA